ncbi:MAG: hypothetical protein R3F39_10575 [Myxococcota bacterium]
MNAPRFARAITFGAALALTVAAGCETYNPPPEVEILPPQGGQWFPDSPLVLRFTEPVDVDSVRFSVWPVDLDIEGDLKPTAVAVATDCTPSQGVCGGLTMTLSDDLMTLTLDQGDTFLERLASPYFVEVAAGLADLSGRERKVPTRLIFQVDPESTTGAVDITLNSGVFSISADLGDVLAGTFLRMIADMRIDPDTGEVWFIATVAGRINETPTGEKVPANTNDPAYITPRIDEQGWVLAFKAQITPLPEEGAYYMQTEVRDVDVRVLGVIRVRLNSLRLSATLRPGGGPDGRDAYIGVLSSAKVLLGDDGEDLGAVAAADWLGFGYFATELAEPRFEGLPRLCEPKPCEVLVSKGGECQLTLPWSQPSPCQ